MAALMPSHSASSFGHVASSSSQPIFRFGSAPRPSSVPTVFECARHRFKELWENDYSETGVFEWRMRERVDTTGCTHCLHSFDFVCSLFTIFCGMMPSILCEL
eukprot:337370_1